MYGKGHFFQLYYETTTPELNSLPLKDTYPKSLIEYNYAIFRESK